MVTRPSWVQRRMVWEVMPRLAASCRLVRRCWVPAGGFGAVLAGVVEAFSASVGAPAGDQAAPVPLADRLRGHLQVGGYLAGGEHAGGAEPAGVRAQAACVAERGQVLHGEGPAPAAGDSPAVEDRGDLVEGVVVEELAGQIGRAS